MYHHPSRSQMRYGVFFVYIFILRTAAALKKDRIPPPLDDELWIKAQGMDVSCPWYIFFLYSLFFLIFYLHVLFPGI